MRKPAKPPVEPPEAVHVTVVEGDCVVDYDGGQLKVSKDGKRIDTYTSKFAKLNLVFKEAARKGAQIGVSVDANKIDVNGIAVERVGKTLEITCPEGTEVRMFPLVIPAIPEPVLKIGDIVNKHGWRYGGISKTTGRPMYVAPKDAGEMNLKHANKRAQELQEQGARVPSAAESGQLRRNFAALGGFDPHDTYLTSSVRTVHKYPKDKTHTIVDSQNFGDGSWNRDKKRTERQTRFVCG